MLDSLHSAARATRMNTNGKRIHSVLFSHIFLHSLFVIGSSFPFHKGNRTGGAGGQAIAHNRAEAAKKRAEEILARKNLDRREYEMAQARLKRALVRTSIKE